MGKHRMCVHDREQNAKGQGKKQKRKTMWKNVQKNNKAKKTDTQSQTYANYTRGIDSFCTRKRTHNIRTNIYVYSNQ